MSTAATTDPAPRPRPGIGVEIALALGLVTLATIVLNAGVFWLLLKKTEETRRTDLALALSAALIITGTPVTESISIVAPPAVLGIAMHEARWRGYGAIAVLWMLLRHISRVQRLEWSAMTFWSDGAARSPVGPAAYGGGDE